MNCFSILIGAVSLGMLTFIALCAGSIADTLKQIERNQRGAIDGKREEGP